MPRKFVVLLLVAVAAATYWNALRAPFAWDDDVAITTNQSIHQIADSLNPPLETPVSGRPIANLSLALNYAFGELDTTGYHVFNLAVLVACALLLFGIVRRTAQRDDVALAASLIWMVHPLLSETIDYTTQRTESLMGFFYLLTMYAAIRARSRRRSGKWTVIAIASCALGMATKESMVTAPIAIVLYDFVFEFDSPAAAWKARRNLYLGLATTWVELGFIMWRFPRSTVGTAVSPLAYALNQSEMIARYLWLSVWPRSLVVDYGLPRALHVTDVLPQLALILVLIAGTVVALVRWPAAGFLGAMFFLTLAPTSSVVPILSEVGAERRMFLPLAALVVLVVAGVARAIDAPPEGGHYLHVRSIHVRRRIAAALAAIAVLALAVRTVDRHRDYASPLALWQSVVDRRPHGRARFGLANQLMDGGRHDEAIAQLRLAVADYPDARAGLGTELLVQGHLEEGIGVLEAFIQTDPSLPNRAPARVLLARAHRAIAERELSRQNAALAATEARKSVELDASNADAHNLLGAALASQGDLASAIPEFQAAVRINPQLQTAASNLERARALLALQK